MEHITLYHREGSSDKIYQASLQSKDEGYVVHFAYGRRGSTLATGTKTQSPIDYAKAKAIYDKLVREKTAKGYTPGESGTPYQHTDKAAQATGILPQLLNAIGSLEADLLVHDPDWIMQEKFDGRRLLIRKSDCGVEGINRLGLIAGLPLPVAQAVEALADHFILDGECIGDRFIAFDLLEHGEEDLRSLPYHGRLFRLTDLINTDQPHLETTVTATSTALKTQMMERLKADQKEGGVFKKFNAPYVPGRPNMGGDALKLKFYETASFLVGQINEQRSVSLTLFSAGVQVPAGNVTIPPNRPIPEAGEIVEVRYLYAFPESGCVYQPVYLGLREDIPATNCVTEQIKFKPATAA